MVKYPRCSALNVTPKATHPLIRKGVEDSPVRLPCTGFLCVRGEFQKGNEGKGPFPQPGMGYFQRRSAGVDTFSEKQYVNVQGTLPPAPFPAPVPAVGLFDILNQGKKLFRRAGIKSRRNGIEKTPLVFNMERLCLVERSPPEFIKKRGKLL
jgi:hypothetical protein